MGFLEDSLNKHLRTVQGPSPEEVALHKEVASLKKLLQSTREELHRVQSIPPERAPWASSSPRAIFGRIIELTEHRTAHDQTVTISMKMDARLMAPTERHEREMIAREVSNYVEQELLRCRLVDNHPTRAQALSYHNRTTWYCDPPPSPNGSPNGKIEVILPRSSEDRGK